jgi:hypothetical protein
MGSLLLHPFGHIDLSPLQAAWRDICFEKSGMSKQSLGETRSCDASYASLRAENEWAEMIDRPEMGS